MTIPCISTLTGRHIYTSTACIHAQHEPHKYSHTRCRKSCKFCAVPCNCPCHDTSRFHAPDIGMPKTAA